METSPTESEFKKPLRVLIRAYAQAVSQHARLETTEAAGHVKNTLMNVERRLDEIAEKLGETL